MLEPAAFLIPRIAGAVECEHVHVRVCECTMSLTPEHHGPD